jgi:LysR family transcriptional activator of nhaA
MEWINFRHLYSFWMVSHTLSFTQAAAKMNVAQSAVSDQVAQLEDYLGEKLFLRSTRKLELTDAGLQLLNYADVIFETSRDINSTIKDRVLQVGAKRLNIGIVGGISRNFIFRMLSNFAAQYPDTLVHVVTGSYKELTTSLKKYELDMIVTLELPKKKDLEEFTYQKIGHSPLILAGNKQLVNSIKSKRRKSPVEIYKFYHPYETELLENTIRPSVHVKPVLRMASDDIPLLRFYANSKKGLVLIPRMGVWEDIESGSLSFIELKKCPEINVYGVFTKRSIHQRTLEELLESASELV